MKAVTTLAALCPGAARKHGRVWVRAAMPHQSTVAARGRLVVTIHCSGDTVHGGPRPAVPILCKGAVMKFGFTNDKAEYDRVVAFRMAAIADGWTLAPTYEHEPAESHATMSSDGFKAHVKARIKQPGEKWKYETEVSLWGPDGLHIPTPEVYSMDTLVEALRVCPKCKAKDVDTVRYSFAGRCCNVCLPEMRRRHEYPGWAS